MNEYVGNPLQVRGAEEYVLQRGKGDGMHFLFIRNGLGLEAWISLDRCGDLSRVSFKGDNMGYFSPCGYVAPQYYDCVGDGFLKSFTAGFFTTCGLTAAGSPCVDDGEELPLHGTIANTPSVLNGVFEDESGITVYLTVTDARIFSRKLVLSRKYFFSYSNNSISVEDTVTNKGDKQSPYIILYHCNMGYPLLDENSIINIPNNSYIARNEHAAEFYDTALKMEKPQAGYEECCYFYDVKENNGKSVVGIYSDAIDKGLTMTYSKKQLPSFTQWKMMGQTDYVLGLEPSNCALIGRDELRKRGELPMLNPGESGTTGVTFEFTDIKKDFLNKF